MSERVILHRREKVLEERNRLDREMRAMTDNAANFITYLRGELNSRLDLMLNGIGSEISRIRTQLSAVSPLSVLDRGYAIVYDDHRNMITRAGAAEKEKDMTLRFADGEIAVSGKGQAWRQKQ